MIHQLWEIAKESITAYTGLSPATFFKVLAVVCPLYYMALNLFCYSDDGQAHHGGQFGKKKQTLPPPVQVGEITEAELKQYDGSDPKKPLLMAIEGQIYDVSQSRMFYGPGGPYALFAGKDTTRVLARMSFEENDLIFNLTGLRVFELEALQDWEYKFMSKYVKVGTIKTTVRASNGAPEREAREAVKTDAAKPAEAANGDVAKLVEDDQWEGAAYEAEEMLLMLRKRGAKREARKAVKVGAIRTTLRAGNGASEREAREAAETDAAKPAEVANSDVAKPAEDDLWESAAKEAEELLLMLRKRSDFLT